MTPKYQLRMRMYNKQIACMWREKRYRDGRRPLGAWEKALGGTLCESLEAIDPIPGRLGSSDACVVTIMSIAPVHRHANSTRPHRGIVHSTSTHNPRNGAPGPGEAFKPGLPEIKEKSGI